MRYYIEFNCNGKVYMLEYHGDESKVILVGYENAETDLSPKEAGIFMMLIDKAQYESKEMIPAEEFCISLDIMSKKSVENHIRNIRKYLDNRIFNHINVPAGYSKNFFIKNIKEIPGEREGGYYLDAKVGIIDDMGAEAEYPGYLGTPVTTEDVTKRYLQQDLLDSNDKKLISNLCGSAARQKKETKSIFFRKTAPGRNNKYSHLLIVNEGGMGKTTFLTILSHTDTYGLYEEVFYISLSRLLNAAFSNPIPDEVYTRDDRNGYIFRHIRYQYGSIILKNKKYMFLLDGYNELFERDCPRYNAFIKKIRSEIEIISQEYADNITMIISARDCVHNSKLKGFMHCRLTGISLLSINRLLSQSSLKISPELKYLLSYPLYFSLFESISDDDENKCFDSKYDLFETLHIKSYAQACEGKDILNRDMYAFIYFVLIPQLAREMELRRTIEASLFDISVLADRLMDNKKYILRVISEMLGDDIADIELSVTAERLMTYLCKSFPFRNTANGNDTFEFAHQEFREFYAAMAVVCDLKTMPAAYRAGDMGCYELEYNLKNNVQDMAASRFGIKKGDENKKKNFSALFSFRLEEIRPVSGSKNALRRHIENEIHLAYAAFSLDDHFMLRTGAVHDIILPIAGYCADNAELISELGLSERTLSELAEVLGGEAHYYRADRDNDDLSECRKYIECAIAVIGEDAPERVLADHQKAKALLCNAKNIYCGEKGKISYYDTEHSPDKLFYEGLELLEKCSAKSYNMAANLINRIYGSPNMWMLDNSLVGLDIKKAFDAVRSCFDIMTGGYIAIKGTEIIYMARTICMMLLKGYIRLDGNGVSHIVRKTAMPDADTLLYVKKVLKETDGQDMKYYGWVRGFYMLLTDRSAEAKREAAKQMCTCRDYDLAQLTMLLAFSPDSEEIKEFAGEKGSCSPYSYIADILIGSLSKKSLCVSSEIDAADCIYYLADIIKLFDMSETDSGNALFCPDAGTIGRIRSAIDSLDKRYRDTSENYRYIMSYFFGD